MAGNDIVECAGLDGFGRVPFGPFAVVFGGAAKTHGAVRSRSGELPRCSVDQPRVRVLDLAAIDDRLREHAVLIAHAVSPRREFERGHRVEEAGCEAAEAAIAERGVGFAFDDIGERRTASGGKGGIRLVTEIECRERVVQRAADKEFHRHVIDAARLVLAVVDLCLDPAPCQLVTRDLREGFVKFFGVGSDRLGRYRVEQFVVNLCTKRRAINGGFVCIRHSAGTPRYLRGVDWLFESALVGGAIILEKALSSGDDRQVCAQLRFGRSRAGNTGARR